MNKVDLLYVNKPFLTDFIFISVCDLCLFPIRAISCKEINTFFQLLSPVSITAMGERVSLAHMFLFSSRKHRAVGASFAWRREASGSSPTPELPLALNKWARKDTVFSQLEHFGLAIGEEKSCEFESRVNLLRIIGRQWKRNLMLPLLAIYEWKQLEGSGLTSLKNM